MLETFTALLSDIVDLLGQRNDVLDGDTDPPGSPPQHEAAFFFGGGTGLCNVTYILDAAFSQITLSCWLCD